MVLGSPVLGGLDPGGAVTVGAAHTCPMRGGPCAQRTPPRERDGAGPSWAQKLAQTTCSTVSVATCRLDTSNGRWGRQRRFTTSLPPSRHTMNTPGDHMSYSQPPAAPAPAPAPVPGAPAPAAKPERNILGFVALGLAVVGFIFACVPGALIIGWILLPVGFILGLVSIFFKGKAKWPSITAIVVSVVGTIVGVIVFLSVAALAVSDALGGTDVEIGTGDDTSVVEEDAGDEEAPAAEAGTRENPIPLGTPVSSDEWTVVINSVTLAAQDQIAAANPFNEAPDAGTEYILVNYSVTYTGSDAEGGMPAFVGVEYVTGGGNTVSGLDKLLVAPDAIDTLSALYEGATVTGNIAIQVPTPVDGVLAVRAGMLADKVFVAIQ